MKMFILCLKLNAYLFFIIFGYGLFFNVVLKKISIISTKD